MLAVRVFARREWTQPRKAAKGKITFLQSVQRRLLETFRPSSWCSGLVRFVIVALQASIHFQGVTNAGFAHVKLPRHVSGTLSGVALYSTSHFVNVSVPWT